MFASYEPSWKGAIDGMITAGLLLSLLAVALGAYASRRHPLTKVFAFLVGGFLGMNLAWALHWLTPLEEAFGWFIYARGDEDRWIAYFELRHFVVLSFFGLILGWLCLEVSAPWQQRHQT